MDRATDLSDDRPAERALSSIAPQRIRPVRLLVVHDGDRRLAALERLLGDLGYDAVVLEAAHDASGLIDREGPPDVLVTSRDADGTMRGLVFARECLARYPLMRTIYVSWLPWSVQPRLAQRERMLAAPFTAAGLAAAVAARPVPPHITIVNSV